MSELHPRAPAEVKPFTPQNRKGSPKEGPPNTTDREWRKPILIDECKVKDIPSTILPEPYREYSDALSHSMEIPSGMSMTRNSLRGNLQPNWHSHHLGPRWAHP